MRFEFQNLPKGFAQGTTHALGGEIGQTALRVGSHRRFEPGCGYIAPTAAAPGEHAKHDNHIYRCQC